MRRFSQRGHLVTLSEINITPLLDLAFVLLIIFVITTPLLEQGLSLQLPKGGSDVQSPERTDVRTVDISPEGRYHFQGKQMNFADLARLLVAAAESNPNLVVFIRADRTTPFDAVFQLSDLCAETGIRISWRSEPGREP